MFGKLNAKRARRRNPKLQLGISTASYFAKCNVEESFERIALCGTDLCEVFLNTACEYVDPLLSTIENAMKKNNLRAYSVHPLGVQFEAQLFSTHNRQREDAIKTYCDVLSAAKKLGARYYVMHGPAHMGGTVKNMQIERTGPIMKELCDIAKEYGVFVAVENVVLFLLSRICTAHVRCIKIG